MYLKKYHIFLLLFCVLSIAIISQTEKDHYFSWDPKPLKLLPSFIPIKDSIAYLWIDSSEIRNRKIIVYIINNSNEVLNFNGYQLAQIQPEFKADDNNWYRVKSLFYGWCGTSFLDRVTIRPKEFYITEDYLINGNTEGQIRYSFYGTNLESSNVIYTSFDTNQVEIAKYDDITYMYCDAEYLANVIIKLPKPYKKVPANFKNLNAHQDSVMLRSLNGMIINNAIDALNRRFPEKLFEVMTLISEDKNHILNKFAKDWLLNHKK